MTHRDQRLSHPMMQHIESNQRPTIPLLDRLEALEEIKLLKARRDRFVDTKDWSALEALHAPEHHSYNGDYQPWTTAAEMIANVREIMKDLRTAHHSHTPEITFESPTRASGIWAMTGISLWNQGQDQHWFLACGHYYETYAKRQGNWLFTSRRLEYILTKTSPGGVFPPPPPNPRIDVDVDARQLPEERTIVDSTLESEG